jgi:excisionase family DNA binding protein
MHESPYLTVAQVADRLQVSQDYVRSLIARGDLASVKLPGSRNAPVRIPAESLGMLLESSEVIPPKAATERQAPRHRRRRSPFAAAWGVS